MIPRRNFLAISAALFFKPTPTESVCKHKIIRMDIPENVIRLSIPIKGFEDRVAVPADEGLISEKSYKKFYDFVRQGDHNIKNPVVYEFYKDGLLRNMLVWPTEIDKNLIIFTYMIKTDKGTAFLDNREIKNVHL